MASLGERPIMRTSGTSSDTPVLVLDYENIAGPPRNFRTTRDPYKTESSDAPTRYGLDGMNASAARQFSELDLQAVLPQMSGQVYIIDLRQESHGFVNGNAVSWYGLRNHANVGKTAEQIAELETDLISQINSRDTVSLHRIVRKTSGRINETSVDAVDVRRAETEQDLAERLGLKYVRIPVTDHQHPEGQSVEKFVDFVRTLPEDAWLHFHCRSGSGRASAFMVLYDIFRDATAVSLEHIIQRQALLGSKDLSRISELDAKQWKNSMAMKRRDFISTFYDYMVDPSGYGYLPWTAWLKQQGLP